jgi:1-acyl-sn-glycerol-3-phosphate acyltransferase
MFAECERQLRAGSSILMFPEGTRSTDGRMREFRGGAFLLALRAGVPVVPIVLDGTFDLLAPRSWVFSRLRPAPVLIRVLPPIDPTQTGGDAARLQQLARERMCNARGDGEPGMAAPAID